MGCTPAGRASAGRSLHVCPRALFCLSALALLEGIAAPIIRAAEPPVDVEILPAASPAAGFAQALSVRPFVFPRDHGPHPEFRQEWWYLSGNLDAAGGERFGFELTFFRFALTPPTPPPPPASPPAPAMPSPSATPPAPASAWRAREVYMAHFAVTDVARQRFRFEQKLSRAALDLAGSQADPLKVWVDDWWLREEQAPPGSGTAPRWTVRAVQPGYAIELSLRGEGAPVLNGEAGLSRKSDAPGSASYYYSMPRLEVIGHLLRDGRSLEVHGSAWLDREWGSGGLGPQQAGWDWFALQLEDGSALMFYALRTREGRRDPHSAGTWIDASGVARPLASQDVTIAVLGDWRNARGERYPARWRLRVPSLALDLEVRPVLADQELSTSPPYWEGAVDVSGSRAGSGLGGRGYVELTGYARER